MLRTSSDMHPIRVMRHRHAVKADAWTVPASRQLVARARRAPWCYRTGSAPVPEDGPLCSARPVPLRYMAVHDHRSSQQTMDRADDALYTAKRAGRGRWQLHDDIEQSGLTAATGSAA